MSDKKIMALSHSRLSDFNQCPRKFKLRYIDKVKEFGEDNKSAHLVRGTNVHAALEQYIVKRNSGENGIRPSSLSEVESTKPLIDKLFNNYTSVLPENQVSIDNTWAQTDWFSKTSYYRAIFDMICIRPQDVMIVDFKTGKLTDYTPSNGYGQLELSAAIALSLWSNIPTVNTAYVYVDHKKSVSKTFTQQDKPRLVQWFKQEHDKVNAEEEFKPKVNEFCKWCPATKVQCPFSRKL